MITDGYTVSDVVMYWRDEPVVGVEKAELPQFTIVGWETNERKIKLATGNMTLTSVKIKVSIIINRRHSDRLHFCKHSSNKDMMF